MTECIKHLWLVLAAVVLIACGASPSAERTTERSEEMEQSAGDEAALVGRNPNDMDDWDSPGGEVEAEMEAAPYPE